jgi:hypothetical protein
MAWCRNCGKTFIPGRNGTDWKPDPAVAAAWLAEREQSEQERMAEINRALELLQREQVWTSYHENLTSEIRGLYEKRGIPEFWQDYLQLGYDPEKWFTSAGSNYISPSLTIPIFEPGGSWKALGVKHRLLKPADHGDKYRPEMRGLPAALYMADPDRKLTGRVMIVEGEFKAITTNVFIDDVNLTVVGVPSKSPDIELLDQLAECDPVTICLDPDAYVLSEKQRAAGAKWPAIKRLADHFRGRSRVMQLPFKIDDAIVAGALDKWTLRRMMNMARAA